MSAGQLETMVRALRVRARVLGISAGVLWALAAGLGVLFLWVWIDLLAAPPGIVRVAGVVAAAIVFGAVFVARYRRTSAACARGVLAQRLDGAAGAKGQVVAGVDLLAGGGGGNETALTRGLRMMAIERAAGLARGARLAVAAPARPAWRALGAVSGIVLAMLVMALVAPNLVRTQWNRFKDPFGDHAAYSRLQIQVKPGNVDVVYGGAVDIRATVENGAVDQLETVLSSQDGAKGQEVIPMFAEPDGTWRTALANVVSSGTYFVRSRQGGGAGGAGGARSDGYAMRVITVPRIASVNVRITAPAYARQPVFDGAVPAGGLNVLAGSQVEFRVASNRPLSGGVLEFAGNKKDEAVRRVALSPSGTKGEESSEVRGIFKVEAEGKLTVRVRDTAGQDSTDVFTTSVALLADERPFVRILEPREMSFATPDAKIPVELMAEDDYGITSLTLYRSLNDSRALGSAMVVPANFPSHQRGTATLLFGKLGLRPGDMIKLVGRAEDNDPAGAKGSESPPTTIQIISQEQYLRMMVARAGLETLLSKYQEAERHLENTEAALRKMREALKEKQDSPLSAEERAANDATAESADDAADEVAKARDMVLPFDIDRSLTPHLDRVSKRLEHVAMKLKEKPAAEKTVGDQILVLDDLIGVVGQEEKDFAQDTIEPLDYLAKLVPLIIDQEKFVQIYQREAALVERLGGIKGDRVDDSRQKGRMRDMEQEQGQIHANLTALLDAIEAHIADLPDDADIDDFRKSAETFAHDLRGTEIDDHMTYAAQALGDFWIITARTETDEVMKILKRFVDDMDGGGGGMAAKGKLALKFKPSLGKNLGNTVAQLVGAGGGGGQGAGSSDTGGASDVGVYGNLPLAGKGGGGDKSRVMPGIGGAIAHAGSEGEGAVAAGGKKGAAGASAIEAPPEYRRRVGQYFQRVADEMEKE